ncbi:MAG TPA: hypothetical protein VMW69_06245, partial [Spirochaetia bacterium]|nr:hypothetical protein [Spirochaetia bacterium]
MARAAVALVLCGIFVACGAAKREASPAGGLEKAVPAGCLSVSAGGKNSAKSLAGSWYAFSGGRAVSVADPQSLRIDFLPWTVQAHSSGFLRAGSTIFVALNGWGLVAMKDSLPGGGSTVAFREFEDRNLFDGRTINGFYDDADRLVLHVYRNTVFQTPAPRSLPISYVGFDPSAGILKAVVLPLTLEGWEASD